MKAGVKRMLLPLYFGSLPWANVLINARFRRGFTTRYIPRELMIEVTNRCNAKCVMCPHEKMKRPRGHMAWETFAKIVNDAAAFEGSGLWLTLHKDGEPFLDPLLFDRIACVRKQLPRSWVQFNSNAQLLTDEMAARLLQTPPDRLVLSVDGAMRESYERIRGGLSYDTVRRNIESFLDRRRAAKSPLKVTMQMVVNRENLGEVDAYRRQWAGKVDAIVFKPMHNFLVQGTSAHGGALRSEQTFRCRQPFSNMVIFWTGEIGLCCWDYDHLIPLGNVRDDTLLDLYNSAAFAAVRRAMIRRACSDLQPCNTCSRIYGLDDPLQCRWDGGIPSFD
jgi:sulfatase maturation enzyme AslB (radical SAM superfamily)